MAAHQIGMISMRVDERRVGISIAGLPHVSDRNGIDRDYRFVLLILLALLLAAVGQANAREITIEHKGLTLNANLQMADGKSFSDGMVLILHGAWGHNKLEVVSTAQQALRQIDRSSLAINLSLGMDNRHGFYDCDQDHTHIQDDAIGEIQAWVDWLKQQGVPDIILLGHSYGSNQALVYVIEREDPGISHLILLAPNTRSTLRKANTQRFDDQVDNVIQRAQAMIAADKGDEFMEDIDYKFCPRTRVTANSYASYYSPSADRRFHDFEANLPKLTLPTLVTTGTLDERQPNIAQHVLPFVDGKRIHLHVIEGAGHFFRDFNIDEAMEHVLDFLQETSGA